MQSTASARFAEPAFHCNVENVPHPISGELFPVVIVTGGHTAPIRAKRSGPNEKHIRANSYYVRRPGPNSEEPQSGREWDELIRRCVIADRERVLEEIRRVMEPRSPISAEGRQGVEMPELDEWMAGSGTRWKQVVTARLGDLGRFEHGTYEVAYQLTDMPQNLAAPVLLEAIRGSEGGETGWPMWWTGGHGDMRPYPYDGLIECWLGGGKVFADAAHSDFWRASPSGLLYIRRGYQEDSAERVEAGSILDLTLPVWRVAEALLHARRLADALDTRGTQARFVFRWSGLEGRRLQAWASNRILSYPRICRQAQVESRLTVVTDEIDALLSDVTEDATRPLYEAFEFFTFARQHQQEEIERFRQRRG